MWANHPSCESIVYEGWDQMLKHLSRIIQIWLFFPLMLFFFFFFMRSINVEMESNYRNRTEFHSVLFLPHFVGIRFNSFPPLHWTVKYSNVLTKMLEMSDVLQSHSARQQLWTLHPTLTTTSLNQDSLTLASTSRTSPQLCARLQERPWLSHPSESHQT